jgi:2-methylcitrate dehydratase PrpD
MASDITLDEQDEMRQLCRLVIETDFDSLPKEVVEHAKRTILDTLAATMGGSNLEGVDAFVELVKEKGGKPESLIPFHGGKVPASEAALAIGPMARAMDFGDLDFVAGHCSEYILPALIAASGLKKHVSGEEFIHAFTLGAEVLLRIGSYTKPGISMSQGREGGHYIFGCVAGIGKILGLSQDELENAQGIASAMTQPHSLLMYNPTTLMIRGHHGFICQDAINACLLAQKGITGPRNGVLSSKAGYGGMVNWETDIKAITKNIGKEWRVLKLFRKRYPIAGSALTSVDAMVYQRNQYGFAGADIASVELTLDNRLEARLNNPEARRAQWHPESVHDCQFSVPYGVATAAFDGDLFLDSYSETSRSRSEVRDLMANISASSDSSLEKYAVRIRVTLKTGEQFENSHPYPKGHSDYPLEDSDLIDKFLKCARYSAFVTSASLARSVAKRVLALEKSKDVIASIIAPLTPN